MRKIKNSDLNRLSLDSFKAAEKSPLLLYWTMFVVLIMWVVSLELPMHLE